MNDLVTQYKNHRLKDARKGAGDVLYGYGVCEKNIVLDELGRALLYLRRGNTCLCQEEVERLENLFISEAGPVCGELLLDYVQTENPAWIVQHPGCVLYDHWLDAVVAQCAEIGLNLNVLPHRCDLVDVNLKATQAKVCEILDVGLTIKEQVCDVALDLSAKLVNECKVDFELKIAPLNCGVDFETVLTAVKCGATVDLVAKALNCGYTLKPKAGSVDFCFEDTAVELVDLSLNLSVFLGGPFSGGSMNTSLNSLLPLEQPYGMSPYFYNGSETVDSFDADVVDWLLVSLRSAGNIQDKLSEVAVLLHSDGTVTDVDGNENIVFGKGLAGEYKVAIHHRNHLDIVTDDAVTFEGTPVVLDFSTGLSSVMRLVSGTYVMYAGDVNKDHRIAYDPGYAYSDAEYILNEILGGDSGEVLLNVYHVGDVNMNTNVKYNGSANDKNVILSSVGIITPTNVIIGQFYV